MDPVGADHSRALTGDAVKKYASSQEDAKADAVGIAPLSQFVINGGTVLFLSWVKATGQCALH